MMKQVKKMTETDTHTNITRANRPASYHTTNRSSVGLSTDYRLYDRQRSEIRKFLGCGSRVVDNTLKSQ